MAPWTFHVERIGEAYYMRNYLALFRRYMKRIDITDIAVLGEQFPLRLQRLGFRLVQVTDASGQDQYHYAIPSVCVVPAGPCLMGSDPKQDAHAEEDELPQHTVRLQTYHIGSYPLTVAEYACCVQVAGWPTPDDWDREQQHPDHPVVSLCWQDALAYAQWLARVTGERWRLPTEAEWEKAARGIDGRIYPWGDNWDEARANTRNSGPKGTTPVGHYPNGASSYGVQDMAGNVWEWTSTAYRDYPYCATDGREDLSDKADKVLRGGSWGDDPQDARAACRFDYDPTILIGDYTGIGARLVCGDMTGFLR